MPRVTTFSAVACGTGGTGGVGSVLGSGSGGGGAGSLSLSHDTVADTATADAINTRKNRFISCPFVETA